MSRRVACRVSAAIAVLFSSAAASAQAVPVAVWNMDNTFGTTMTDSSGNGNDGTTYNVVTSGAGYIFDGSTSMAVVPDSPTLNPGTQDFSFTVQVQTNRVPPSGTDYDLLRKGLSATEGGEFKVELIRSNGKAKAFCLIKDADGKQAGLTGKTNLADDALHTITCAKIGTTMTLKVDSLSTLKKRGLTLGSIANTASLIIGAKSPDGTDVDNDWYVGLMRSASLSIAPAE